MVGLDKCPMHVGRKPALVIAERELNQKARRVLAAMGAPDPIGDPLTELLHLAAEAAQWKAGLATLVHDLDEIRYRAASGEQVRGEVQLYVAAMRDLGRLLADIGKLDIDRRLALIEEAKARRLHEVLTIACQRLGIDVAEPRVIEAVQAGIAATEPRGELHG